ncbi:hypothetical protein M407DRAFT_196894 [Tulasnella calospora MUT 4182]|uniref:Uncharacterized protein n=1 Tax=Tulasnella calospora MUT 4182 TaxID=1051891 RepID=A0A0C3Q1E4_9AGAM|nr:hypothetical protein M407DRAFT_196894 [Tulasnella calospora MUT 4182]
MDRRKCHSPKCREMQAFQRRHPLNKLWELTKARQKLGNGQLGASEPANTEGMDPIYRH